MSKRLRVMSPMMQVLVGSGVLAFGTIVGAFGAWQINQGLDRSRKGQEVVAPPSVVAQTTNVSAAPPVPQTRPTPSATKPKHADNPEPVAPSLKLRGDGNKLSGNEFANPGPVDVEGRQNELTNNKFGTPNSSKKTDEAQPHAFLKGYSEGVSIIGNVDESGRPWDLTGGHNDIYGNFSGKKFEDLPENIQAAIRRRDSQALAKAIEENARKNP